MPKRHPVETFFGKLRKWLIASQLAGPGLQQAEVARRFAQRTPPRAQILGGVDELGLAPLRPGEKTRVFIDRARKQHAEALEILDPETALRTTSLILTSRPELLN